MACLNWAERVRILELENQRLMSCQDELIKETNRKLLLYLTELHGAKALAEQLKLENDELKQLCCHLDDDRQRLERESNEWQTFGCYATDVLSQDVAAYCNQLLELENRQKELMSMENNATTVDQPTYSCRDAGDGASNPDTVSSLRMNGGLCEKSDQEKQEADFSISTSGLIDKCRSLNSLVSSSTVADQLQQLETRVRQLEEGTLASAVAAMMQTSLSAPELVNVCDQEINHRPTAIDQKTAESLIELDHQSIVCRSKPDAEIQDMVEWSFVRPRSYVEKLGTEARLM